MNTKQIDDAAWKDHPYTFRNNRGIFQVVHTDTKGNRKLRWIRCGIPEPKGNETSENLKGGDRVGWTRVEITPDMVGKTVAVFTNIEIKGPGDTLEEGQKKWHNLVLQHGGISEIWRDVNSEIVIDRRKIK
jgi:hypothetical protein